MKLTRQGVLDLDALGPRRTGRGRPISIDHCQTPADHEWGAWGEDVDVDGTGNRSFVKRRVCGRCGQLDERWQ